MKLILIAAMSDNRVIGKKGRLPWKLPADLKHFKELTWGHTLLMGRKTYESIGRPLPGRRSVVLTRNRNFRPSGVQVFHSLKTALRELSQVSPVFVAGGEQIYRQLLPRADEIRLTIIHERFEGDAFFPVLEEEDWDLINRQDFDPGSVNRYEYSFLHYRRPS